MMLKVNLIDSVAGLPKSVESLFQQDANTSWACLEDLLFDRWLGRIEEYRRLLERPFAYPPATLLRMDIGIQHNEYF